MLTGDTAKAERWAAVVDAASFDGEPATGAASFDSARALLRAGMCAGGPERMMADAAFAVAQEPAWSPWRDTALWLLAEAHLLAGHLDEARAVFAEASAAAAGMSNWDTIPICEAQLAWLAMDRGEWAGGSRPAGARAGHDRCASGCTTTSSASRPSPGQPGFPCTTVT